MSARFSQRTRPSSSGFENIQPKPRSLGVDPRSRIESRPSNLPSRRSGVCGLSSSYIGAACRRVDAASRPEDPTSVCTPPLVNGLTVRVKLASLPFGPEGPMRRREYVFCVGTTPCCNYREMELDADNGLGGRGGGCTEGKVSIAITRRHGAPSAQFVYKLAKATASSYRHTSGDPRPKEDVFVAWLERKGYTCHLGSGFFSETARAPPWHSMFRASVGDRHRRLGLAGPVSDLEGANRR
ncbi:hypothetical protein LX32DRAFT_111789 [Colletotrichum zoysiae]|uniref:Uncharacterized protein n=1 Tax=Colletotrichum zoysiae TaxID=1216348 RepID=A0AAD9LZZ0_9PEZI|nr:hypothetical protein LX32DRAFT_111789 [Colletotrichum zoysiae]